MPDMKALQMELDRVLNNEGARFTRKGSTYLVAHVLGDQEGRTEVFPANDSAPLGFKGVITAYERRDDGLMLTDEQGHAMYLYPLGPVSDEVRQATKRSREEWMKSLTSQGSQ